jgi:hypothetical protein
VVSVPENVDDIQSMILESGRISAPKDNKDSGDISGLCRVHHPDVLDMRKLSAI